MSAGAGVRAATARAGGSTAFTGTGALVRLALRRDRVLLPVWVGLFALVAGASASTTAALYPTAASRLDAARVLNASPSLVALYGRVYDESSLGALSLFKLAGLGAAMVGVLSVVVVVRHTRADEEAGRLELLGSSVVGRMAPLTAALAVVGGADLALALLTAAALAAAGLPAAGSLAFGLAWGATGAVFAAVAAVAAQLAPGARGATGLGVAVLGATYLLRAVGDSASADGPRWLSWGSPVGMGQQVRPFAGDVWWVLPVMLGVAGALVGAAFRLRAARDVGAGLLADRPGPARAGPGLGGTWGLAWRLHRWALAGWAAGFVVLGSVLGSIATNVGGLLDNERVREVVRALGGQHVLTDAFLAAELGVVGLVAAAYGVQAAGRLGAEETGLHAEWLLAHPVGRVRWAAGHAGLALAGSAALLLAGGLAAGAGYALGLRDPARVGPVVAAALVRAPAAWVLVAVAVAAFGLVPRWSQAGWAVLAAAVVVGELGPLLGLPGWVLDLSPFTHVPALPGGQLRAVPLLALTAVAAGLLAAGLAGFRRRDLR